MHFTPSSPLSGEVVDPLNLNVYRRLRNSAFSSIWSGFAREGDKSWQFRLGHNNNTLETWRGRGGGVTRTWRDGAGAGTDLLVNCSVTEKLLVLLSPFF